MRKRNRIIKPKEKEPGEEEEEEEDEPEFLPESFERLGQKRGVRHVIQIGDITIGTSEGTLKHCKTMAESICKSPSLKRYLDIQKKKKFFSGVLGVG